MSNEEAIKILKGAIKKPNTEDGYMGQALEMAIKALEQQTCEDAVSREAVDTLVDELARKISDERCCRSRGRSTATIMQNILDLPPVNPQPKTRWIPVSERLPEEGESVLTQAMFKDDMKMCVSSRIDWNYWTGWGTRNINIIAWMPLPTPARLEKDNG